MFEFWSVFRSQKQMKYEFFTKSNRNSDRNFGLEFFSEKQMALPKYGLLCEQWITPLPISSRNSGRKSGRNSGRNSSRKSRWLCLSMVLFARNELTLLPFFWTCFRSNLLQHCNQNWFAFQTDKMKEEIKDPWCDPENPR